MTNLTKQSSSSKERLVRTSTGADTVWADTTSVPTDGLYGMSAKAPAGKGLHSALEISIVPVDGARAVQARSGTCTIRLTKVIDRGTDDPVAVDSATIPDVPFCRLVRIAANGGAYFIGVEALAGEPAGATGYEVWAKAVAE